MSIEEGKVSEDKDVIKSARSAAKGRVTKQINILKKIDHAYVIKKLCGLPLTDQT